jgi:hypothetical protein
VSTGGGIQGGRIDLRDCPLLGHVTQIDRNRLTV